MPMRIDMLGLAKCSTVQKARKELEAAGFEVSFRDVTTEPLSEAERRALLDEFGEKIVNRGSLTWRGLSEDERTRDPVDLLGDYPALMKRPAIRAGEKRLRGWTVGVRRDLGLEA